MSETELADSIAEAILAVPGVAGLHPGMFGEVGTYLPGRRVTGVRITDDGVDVHVTVHEGVDVRRTAVAVRDAVALVAPGSTVDVTVEDIAPAVRP
ncbi:Asp23/Gls24 family envelope stress response protein [Mycolicibacterium arabiense]|nr:Asp23/Gls24 family envelope stress response protein [Mycolicibacterium arabiense]MCV7371226.1 Asp23/Gls24 family envelope stress response protein [Mycolicibacterium arabiense]